MGLFKTTNYYTHKGGEEYVPYEKDVTIHEHRAPTDESVRLLNEFEEKARKNIIHKISVNENNLNAVSIIFKNNDIERDVIFNAKFELNGHTHILEGRIDKADWREGILDADLSFGHRTIQDMVHNFLANLIATQLLERSPDFMMRMNENPYRV